MESTSHVLGMGRGADGQLGVMGGASREVCLPKRIPALDHVRVSSMSCGMAHSGVVTDTGTLLMFGKGKYGRLGSGDEMDCPSPSVVLIGNDQRVTAISCGAFHTGVVTAKGSLFTFGKGENGQLGHGDGYGNCFFPKLVSSIQQKVTKIACGVDHTICCTAQGDLYGFGSNAKGQLGIGQSDQEMFNAPQRIKYQQETISSTTFPSCIAAGHSFSTIVLDGSVYSWGQNDKGQCGTGTFSPCVWTPSRVNFKESVYATSVSCGLDHTLVVTESGRVYTWGNCEYGQLGMSPDFLSTTSQNKSISTPFLVKEALTKETVVSGSCGSYHSVVVTVDGKLLSWGLGDKGQLGKIVEGAGIAPYPYHVRLKIESQNKDSNTRISVLAAGGRHTLAATYCKPHISVLTTNFSADMKRLYTNLTSSNGSFFDVVIRVQNNSVSFDAHRVFLSRSPKLHQMLISSSELQELTFPSISRECMASILKYMYTNEVPKTDIDGFPSTELVELAQDWGLQHLCASLQIGQNYVEEGSIHEISRHLKKFVNNKEFSDVAFSVSDESGDTVKIHAHKAILALRCEYFSVEFLGNFKESVQPVITLQDTSPSAFLQLLTYLYSDEVSFQSDVVEVLTLSNLYQLEHLKSLCEKSIVEEIDADNAVALYEIAQQYEAKQLEAFCDYFIITQYDRVSKTDDFKGKFLASKQQHFHERHDTWTTSKQESSSSGENRKCVVQ